MRELDEEWTSLWDTYRQSPEKIPGRHAQDKYAETTRMAQNLLRQRLTDKDVIELAASCGTLPTSTKQRSKFENAALGFVVSTLLEMGDRQDLVAMLSTRCPDRVDPIQCVEYCLAKGGKKVRDPILILAEAYLRSSDVEVRHALAAAVRRAFAGLGVEGKDDAEFVENARQWYEKEKGHLSVNPKYVLNDEHCPLELYDRNPRYYRDFLPPFRRELLFVEKP
jgi:hypothetical protein